MELQRDVQREAPLRILERIAGELRRVPQAVAERVSMHEAPLGRLIAAWEVEGRLQHPDEVAGVAGVPGDDRTELEVHERRCHPGVEPVAEQPLEAEPLRGD